MVPEYPKHIEDTRRCCPEFNKWMGHVFGTKFCRACLFQKNVTHTKIYMLYFWVMWRYTAYSCWRRLATGGIVADVLVGRSSSWMTSCTLKAVHLCALCELGGVSMAMYPARELVNRVECVVRSNLWARRVSLERTTLPQVGRFSSASSSSSVTEKRKNDKHYYKYVKGKNTHKHVFAGKVDEDGFLLCVCVPLKMVQATSSSDILSFSGREIFNSIIALVTSCVEDNWLITANLSILFSLLTMFPIRWKMEVMWKTSVCIWFHDNCCRYILMMLYNYYV